MKGKKEFIKLWSILIIIILVSSGTLIILPMVLFSPTTEAASSWEETSSTEFSKGTKSKVEIVNAGTAAEIILESDEWNLIKPSAKPVKRIKHAMASVYGTTNAVLFGGYDSKDCKSDTWVYDIYKDAWQLKTPKSNPGTLMGHAMAADYTISSDLIILFGGFDGTGYYDDTWLYDLGYNTWTEKTPTITPTKRAYHAMSSVAGGDQIVLFGGYYQEKSTTKYYSDTWVYDVSDRIWKEMNIKIAPSARRFHAMAFSAKSDEVVLFGGETLGGKLSGETWIYDLGEETWTEKSPTFNPSPRCNHSMASIFKENKALLFGGFDGKENYETWVFDFKTYEWTQLTPQDNPAASVNHAMTFDWKSDNVVLFGGTTKTTYYDETWEFDYNRYVTSGTFISNTNQTKLESNFTKLTWVADTPTKTSIKFKIKTATTEAGLSSKAFVGPDGKENSYYTDPDSNTETIWSGHKGDTWVQYIAYLSTSDISKTPRLDEVMISYNLIPRSPTLKTPAKGSLLTKNKPTFSWNFIDSDSLAQLAFQVIIDNSFKFTSIDYDSHEVTSPTTSYTPSKPILDGTWYWKVRTKDSDGDWGPYSDYQIFIIDATTPTTFTPASDPSGWTNSSQPIISFSTTDTTSGIDHYEVKIDTGDFTKQPSPYTLPIQNEGIHNITVRAYDVAGNYLDRYVDIYIDTGTPEGFTPEATPSTWTTNTQPVITFTTTDGTSDIDHYELSVNQGIFSIQTSPYTMPSQTDGAHNVRVKAYDNAGNYNEGEVEVYIDSSPPSITHTPVPSGTKDFSITITAFILDEHSGLDNVELFFKKQTDIGYSSLAMNANEGIYSTEISAESVTEDGIEYYIKAVDGSSPANEIYYGSDGETTDELNSFTDIDVSITLDDVTPPTITHVPVTASKLGESISLTASVTDDASGVDTVALFYKKISDSTYSTISMTKSETRYSAELPPEVITSEGMEYYIKVTDLALSPNIAYFGASGQVEEMPNSLNDIDISIIEEDTIAPTVIDKSPIGTDVPVGTTISVTFSEAMDQSATESVFTIAPGLTGQSNWNENKLIFTPDSALDYKTQYSITIGSTAKDLAGNNLDSDFNWQFTTTSTIDTTAPSVVDKTPTGSDVPVGSTISVAFNEPMLREETKNAFLISPNVTGAFNWIGSTLTFIPNPSFEYDTQYTVSITTAAKDLVGNNLDSQFSWQFVTASYQEIAIAPIIKNKLPVGNNVSLNTTVQILFSDLMEKEDTENAFTIFPTVLGDFHWQGQTLTFKPIDPLVDETGYIVSISTYAKNLNGNHLEQEYNWSFKTGSAPGQETLDEGPKDNDTITEQKPSDGKGEGGLGWDELEPILTVLTILGTIIVTLIGILKIRKRRTKLQEYIDKIDAIYMDYKIDYKTCEKELIVLKDTIKVEFKKGKIEDNHYLILDKKIGDYIQELRTLEKTPIAQKVNVKKEKKEKPKKENVKEDLPTDGEGKEESPKH